MNITLNPAHPVPLYLQLYHHIRDWILSGRVLPGSRLPASRELAQQCHVARITVTQAYEQLAAEGYVVRRRGAGVFVSESLPLTEKRPFLPPFTPVLSTWGQQAQTVAHSTDNPETHLEIDFGFGRSIPHIFPYAIWRRLLDRYLSTDDFMLSRYGSVAGYESLRQALASYLARQRGVRCTWEQVVIVSGVQQALDLIARLWLSKGDEVLVETPGYADAFDLFKVHGAHLRPLPVDDEGFPVEQIPADCHAKLVFVTPCNQFPRGGTMSLRRRLALLAWARQQRVFILEDDYDGELRYDGRPLAALQGLDEDGRVIYLGTFSKVLFPALRLAYVVLPPALVEPFLRAKGLVDRGAPTLTQTAVADFITEGHFERHLRHLRQEYGERRERLVQNIREYLPSAVHYVATAAGLHIMLYLPPTCDENRLVREAAAVGVGIYPGRFYHLQNPAPATVLLSFSGLNEAEITEGIHRIAQHCRWE